MSLGAYRTLLRALLLLALCSLSGVRLAARAQHSDEAARREARQLWEAIIKAKGGRARLHGLQNVFVEWGKPPTSVFLFAFPDKFWNWTSEGPKPERDWTTMTFSDGASGAYYWITPNETIRSDEDPQGSQRSMDEETLRYLLETKWVQPEPIRVRRVREGRRQLDIVETRLNGERIDFVVEVEELLVLKVALYGRHFTDTRPVQTYLFSDYAPEEGIQMPHTMQLVSRDGQKFTKKAIAFRFNVAYDKDFFKQPPPLSAGPDAWKPR